MQKIKELRPGARIEIKAEIIEEQEERCLLKCFQCDFYDMVTSYEYMGICPNCGKEETKETGKGLWLKSKCKSFIIEDDSGSILFDVWNTDIENYKVGDKIHLINGYAREVNGLLHISKGKFGSIIKE